MNIASIFGLLVKALAGLLILALAALGFNRPVAAPTPLPTQPATSTAADFPTATTTKKVSTPTKATSTQPVVSTPSTQTVPATQPVPTIDVSQYNAQTRAALVNVLCTTLAGGSFKPISGSGVMIDGRGVVLTNAHVAQFFLLRDYLRRDNIDCTIRTGSPAANTYRAELLYLPPAWIDANAGQITATQATGTGENDFAFLYITASYNPAIPLPATLPHLAMSNAPMSIGDTTLLAAYPAGFLSGELIATQLYASSAVAYVTQLFSFDSTSHVDLFSIGGSIESQAGSSGGAVVRQSGSLAGIISTAILSGSTNERDLRAITVDYINRALKASGQGGIADLLSGDIAQKAADFDQYTAPGETAKLEAALKAAQ